MDTQSTYERSTRAMSDRLGWPAGVADSLIRLTSDYPRMITWWSPDGNGRTETRGGGFYSWHQEMRLRSQLPYYAQSECDMRLMLVHEPNAQPEVFPHYQTVIGNGDK
jgi:hypothetical protein